MLKWFYYHIKTRIGWRYNKYFGSYFHGNYAHRKILNMQKANELIMNMIEGGKPFAIARFGQTELGFVANHEWEHLNIKKASFEKDYKLYTNAGFFPNGEKYYTRFFNLMMNDIKEIDAIGVWFNVMEEYIVDQYMNNAKVIPLMSIEPYYFVNPWSAALKDKKVLIIHPFAETIKLQYKKHTQIFTNKSVLPPFELKTIKAVQTIADQNDDRFHDWFEALQYMENEMKKIDFDIAIIGCGAYGLPLAVEAKRMGKQAIHMGGATQILFGIKGKRWDIGEPRVKAMYNNNWVRPLDSDKPQGADKVEDSCYW